MAATRRRRMFAATPTNQFQPPALLTSASQTDGAAATSRTYTIPTGGALPAGSLVVILPLLPNAAVGAITDSQGNAWTQRAATTVGANGSSHWSSVLTTGLAEGDTITITTTSSVQIAFTIAAFTHITASGPVDTTAVNSAGGSTSTPTAPDVTTTADYDLVLTTFVFGSGSPGTFTPATGWSTLPGPSLSASRYMRPMWRLAPTAGIVTPAATIQTARAFTATTVAYKQG